MPIERNIYPEKRKISVLHGLFVPAKSMKIFRYILQIPFFIGASIWLILGFGTSVWFFKQHAHRLLELPEGKSLTSKELRRLKHYFYGTSYLSFLFSMLRGKTRTPAEKYRFVNLSALAYHFDDLADTFNRNRSNPERWKGTIKEYGQKADQSGLAIHFLQNIEQTLTPSDCAVFESYMERVFLIETDGRQLKREASPEMLLELTREKGGCSVLMFRTMQGSSIPADEEQAWYRFGGLIQLCDDIFDIWFDHTDGVTTLATEAAAHNYLQTLTNLFEKEVRETRQAFFSTNKPWVNQRVAWYGIHYIVAITRVCLSHYQDLVRKYGKLPIEQRQTLVLDMEKWRNRFRAAWYCLRF